MSGVAGRSGDIREYVGRFDNTTLEGSTVAKLSIGRGVANVGRGASGKIFSDGKLVGNSIGFEVGTVVGKSHTDTESA
jgi:hypothetical protein